MSVQQEAIDLLIAKSAERFGRDPATLGPDTSFEDDLGCSSVDYVQLSTALEDEFEVEVPFMDMKRAKTFAGAGSFVASQLGM